MTMHRYMLAAVLLIALLSAGCRFTGAVAFGGDADATMEAGKQYEGVDITPSLTIPIPLP